MKAILVLQVVFMFLCLAAAALGIVIGSFGAAAVWFACAFVMVILIYMGSRK